MRLYFRELNNEDVPQILDISKKIWEGEDYIPRVIREWLKEQDCYNYGGFLDHNKTQLVGFGRVKVLSDELVWLEGGRVKKEYQQQGIGLKLMEHALTYAEQNGAKKAQFDTSSENLGSISLAQKLGFKKKDRMELLTCTREEISNLESFKSSDIEQLTPKQALSFYQNIDNGPENELCVGWSYIPLELKYLREQEGRWIRNNGAIIHVRSYSRTTKTEVPKENVNWIIAYGTPSSVKPLLENLFLKREDISGGDTYYLFCHPALVSVSKEVGFHSEEEGPEGVILYEKRF